MQWVKVNLCIENFLTIHVLVTKDSVRHCPESILGDRSAAFFQSSDPLEEVVKREKAHGVATPFSVFVKHNATGIYAGLTHRLRNGGRRRYHYAITESHRFVAANARCASQHAMLTDY